MSSEEKVTSTTVVEGSASVNFPGAAAVFYNPVQQFNRDLSICVLREFLASKQACDTAGVPSKPKKVKLSEESSGPSLLEALAASGLRSIRYAREVAGLAKVVANDQSKAAVACIDANIEANSVGEIVSSHLGDAIDLMQQHRHLPFEVVDLDPYGSPTRFLDAAVQCVEDGGLLMVTSTDMAVLCGNSPEKCFVAYAGSLSIRSKCCHEMALRILLRCIDSHANRYGKYIEPLLSVSVDFYVRVFVVVRSGQAMAKNSVCKASLVYQCTGCESIVLQPLAKKHEKGKSLKFVNAAAPTVNQNCDMCGSCYHLAGPIWSAPLHNQEFVTKLFERIQRPDEQVNLGTAKRIVGTLSVVLEELPIPLYYVHDRLFSICHLSCPKMKEFRSALLNGGYEVSISHACAQSVKTNAPNSVIWDIVRCWAKLQNRLNQSSLAENSPAKRILERPPSFEANFKIHPQAEPKSRLDGMLRFQQNPEKFWGPMARAKTVRPDHLPQTDSEDVVAE